jgi:endonuclease G
MQLAAEIIERKLDRAMAAGKRWQSLIDRRAETVRLLKLGGPTLADSPARVEQYFARESAKALAYARAGVTETFFSERRIGPTLDLDENPPNETARTAGVPVGRIVELDRNGRAMEGFATGFLVAPNLMLTNHHVFASAAECSNCGIQFGYEKVSGVIAEGTVFALDTRLFFFSDEQLDFAVVGVSPLSTDAATSLDRYKTLPLIPTVGKILVGQPVSIIQYPDGGPKKYGVRDNELLIAPTDADLFLQYTTDTLPGSSGSPAFNKDWEVVALHHSGVPEIKDGQILTIRGTPWSKGMPDTDIHWIANEGVRVSRICVALRDASVLPQYEPARRVLLETLHEDFSKLPALATPTEASPVTTNAIAGMAAERGIGITVNGTANFYFDGGSPQATEPKLVTVQSAPIETAEKKLRFDPNYEHRKGYDDDFLGVSIPIPRIAADRSKEILKSGGDPLVLKYHHYSVVMNKERRLQMWSAVNVDYTKSKRRKTRDEFGTDTWVADPRIPGNVQIEDQELYAPALKFDRGHVVRRDDTAWGDTALEEIFANSDSFHWTNCTPQHEQFNRDKYGFHGLWGALENHIQQQAKNVGNRMSIFAGPILDNKNDLRHDFGGGEIQIPTRFWKVIFATEDAGTDAATLRAYGFILDQQEAIDEFGLEAFSAGKFKVYQLALDDISQASGVTFAKEVLDADALQGAPHETRRRLIESLADVAM